MIRFNAVRSFFKIGMIAALGVLTFTVDSASAQVDPNTGQATIATPGPIASPRTPWYRRPQTPQQQPTTTTTQQPSTNTQPQQRTTRAQPSKAGQYTSETEARARCLGGYVVWANTDSKIFHYSGTPYYGRTKKGAFMCERDTASAGIRAAKNQARPTS